MARLRIVYIGGRRALRVRVRLGTVYKEARGTL